MGDVVNTAQRLQSAAEPGQVLVGQATYLYPPGRHLSLGRDHRGQGQERTGVGVGGRGRPAAARYRPTVIGRRSSAGTTRWRSSPTRSTSRSTRAAALLCSSVTPAWGSRGSSSRSPKWRGCHDGIVLQGRCVPYGEANVWWPLAEAVRSGCDLEPGDDQETAASKVRRGRRRHGQRRRDGSDRRGRAAPARVRRPPWDRRGASADEATGALLAFAAAARQRPLVIVLSDLHWADSAVLGVLEALLERNAWQPIVVLATARPALAERWSPPEGGHHSVVVHVDPSVGDAATRVLHLLADDKTVALDDTVVAELLDRAGGNPLFLEELVSWLEESRSTALPDTLRGLVAARPRWPTPQERLVLEDAAVLGSLGQVEWLATMHREAHGATAPSCSVPVNCRPRIWSPSTASLGVSAPRSSERSPTAR